jgi:hypothetical protein
MSYLSVEFQALNLFHIKLTRHHLSDEVIFPVQVNMFPYHDGAVPKHLDDVILLQ